MKLNPFMFYFPTYRKNKNKDNEGDKPNAPVRFTIAEEDEEETAALMPEIVVDPPSKAGSPDEAAPLKQDDSKV